MNRFGNHLSESNMGHGTPTQNCVHLAKQFELIELDEQQVKHLSNHFRFTQMSAEREQKKTCHLSSFDVIDVHIKSVR